MKVVFTPVSDYAAVVESLATKKIDLAWLGGFTYVQAKIRTNGTAIPIVQRAEDAVFTSKFITADPNIKALADLKGKTFAFGAPSSTSGSLMPRYFLQQAGLNPEKDFRNVAFSGAQDATVLRLQLDGARRPRPGPGQEADRRLPQARRGQPGAQGNPRPAARSALHPHDEG